MLAALSCGSRHKWPAVLAAAIIFELVIVTSVLATAERGAQDFEIYTAVSTRWALAGLVLPLGLCVVLDLALTSTAWDFLGAVRSALSTTEPDRPGRFVLRPLNTYSSHAHSAAGAYVCARATETVVPLAATSFGTALTALGVISHAWWASRRQLACRIDNLLMETHVLALASVALSLALPPTHELWLVAATIALTLFRAATFSGEAALVPCVGVLIGSLLYAAHSLGGCGQWERLAIGLGLPLIGVVFKVADSLGDGCHWGTAAFHYLSASGFVAIFLWAQTLPARI